MINHLLRKRVAKRSPIEGRVLYQPGSSLRGQQIDKLVDATALFVGLFMLAVGFLVWEAVMAALRSPRRPLLALSIAMPICVFACIQFFRAVRRLERLQLGREGEMLVGQLLVDLRPDGYRAFHDLRGRDFNVDHVLVGPAGVFAIETKTVSKRLRDPGKVIYDGTRVTVGGDEQDRDPLVQAKAAARHVREVLRLMTGREVPVTPVLVYPGWFVETTIRGAGVMVQNEKMLLSTIRAFPRRLENEDIDSLAAALARHVIEDSQRQA